MGGHAKPSCERQLSVQLVVFSTAAAFATCARLGPRCDSAARSVQSVRSDKGFVARNWILETWPHQAHSFSSAFIVQGWRSHASTSHHRQVVGMYSVQTPIMSGTDCRDHGRRYV